MERREFIKLSLSAAGGLSLGFYLPVARSAAAASTRFAAQRLAPDRP